MKRQTLIKFATVVITAILVAILLSQVEISDVRKTISDIEPMYLIGGFGFYILTYFFRALRFHVLLDRDVGVKDLFTIICIHNMANNILPARTGELSYIYLLKKFHNISSGKGAATLIIARIFDVSSIAGLFLISTVLVHNLPTSIVKVVWSIVFLLIMLVLVLVILMTAGDAIAQTIRKISTNSKLIKKCFIVYLSRKLEETVGSFSQINRTQTRGAVMLSICIWISLYSVNYMLANAISINVSFWAVLFASTFAMLTTLLPIQGMGGFGTMESGWTVGFMLLGITKETAITSGFSYHILICTFFFTLGLYGMLMLKKFQNQAISLQE